MDSEYAEKIAGEHRAQRVLLNQQKLGSAQLETQSEQQELDRIEAKAAALKAKRAAEQLAREFARERASVLSLLSPFIDRAITQPRNGNPISKGGIKRPTSLGALTSFGALNDTPAGLDALYHAGGHPANMRKKGGFPSFVSMTSIPNESVRQQVRRAQQYLRKYGQLLVNESKLSQ